MPPTEMETILSSATQVVGSLLDTAGDTMTFITAQPLILIPIVAAIAFMGFGVVGRFLHKV